MRVTSGGFFYRMQTNIASSAERYGRATETLSSGTKVARPSDAPADAGALLRLESAESANVSYQRNGTDASGWLAAADTALQDATNILGRASDLGISAVNGARGFIGSGAIADEIDALSNQMLGVANTTHLGASVFSGYGSPAVVITGGIADFTGEVGPVLRQVDADTVVDVATDGRTTFGFDAGDDVFTVLKDLSDAIRAQDSTATNDAMQRLRARQNDVLASAENIGLRTNLVESAARRVESTMLSIEKSRSSIADVDFAKATIDVYATQTAYEAALAAAGRSNMPSLSDFLR